MKFFKLISLCTLLGLVAFSCVSPEQYESLLKENEFLEEENNVLREEVAFKEEEHILESKLQADVYRLETEVADTKKRYTTLEKTYLDLSSKYNLMVNDKGGTSYMDSTLNDKVELENLRRTLDKQTREMRVIQLTLQQRESQIKDLERLLHGQAFNN